MGYGPKLSTENLEIPYPLLHLPFLCLNSFHQIFLGWVQYFIMIKTQLVVFFESMYFKLLKEVTFNSLGVVYYARGRMWCMDAP